MGPMYHALVGLGAAYPEVEELVCKHAEAHVEEYTWVPTGLMVKVGCAVFGGRGAKDG